MIYPKKLKLGATIGLVSPSSPITEERVKQCIDVIKDMGFNVKAADNIAASKGGYMAGPEEVRGEWINKMFADSEVDAVFCIRGGDGANRIIEFIDTDIIKSNPKIFVGYSDITSLHLLFNQECELVTFHGPMVSSNMVDHFDSESRVALYEALMADKCYEYIEPDGLKLSVARKGSCKGKLTGGNLTVLCNSIATPYDIDTKDKVLFIEEIGAHIGNVDRNIYQLRNCGKLDHVAGILIGQFTNYRQDVDEYGVPEVIKDAIGDKDIPVVYNVQSGHGSPMITLPMGAECEIVADEKKASIRFDVNR